MNSPQGPLLLALLKKKPEARPPERGVQGEANEDWTTVWLPGVPSKMKVITEPLLATMLCGLKRSSIVPPTSPTLICARQRGR